ncbi:hypothetical protein PROPEN_00281 [Proteus penneri ATCC 35198]|nr:hypothetical protein PROPEN_00281 [Proteus penneri ATCC 35198]
MSCDLASLIIDSMNVIGRNDLFLMENLSITIQQLRLALVKCPILIY